MIFLVVVQHGFDLHQCRLKCFLNRLVGHALNKFGGYQHGTRFFLCEHHRGKMKPINNKISFTGFWSDWYPCFHECLYIAVYGAQTDLKSLRHFFCLHYTLGLKMDEDSSEAVDTVHRVKIRNSYRLSVNRYSLHVFYKLPGNN